MRKHFKENENDYTVILTQDAGGRVLGNLWQTTILLTKEFELISYKCSKTRMTSNSVLVNEPDAKEVKQAINYAKGQVNKLNTEVKTADILVNDVYGSGICIKTVDLTASGTPNLKQAGNRMSACDIKPLTDKIQTEMDSTNDLKIKITKMKMELYELKRELSKELNDIWETN